MLKRLMRNIFLQGLSALGAGALLSRRKLFCQESDKTSGDKIQKTDVFWAPLYAQHKTKMNIFDVPKDLKDKLLAQVDQGIEIYVCASVDSRYSTRAPTNRVIALIQFENPAEPLRPWPQSIIQELHMTHLVIPAHDILQIKVPQSENMSEGKVILKLLPEYKKHYHEELKRCPIEKLIILKRVSAKETIFAIPAPSALKEYISMMAPSPTVQL